MTPYRKMPWAERANRRERARRAYEPVGFSCPVTVTLGALACVALGVSAIGL